MSRRRDARSRESSVGAHRAFGPLGVVATVALIVAAACSSTSPEKADSRETGDEAASSEQTVDAVYFIGDSITGGFAWYPDNTMMVPNIIKVKHCTASADDRCTNNAPGSSVKTDDNNTENDSKSPPAIAYPYQFSERLNAAQNTLHTKATPVHNLAVSGSTPAQWDPNPIKNPCSSTKSDLKPDAYTAASYPKNATDAQKKALDASCDPASDAQQWGTKGVNSSSAFTIDQIPENSLTVMTLGANPLLERYLEADLFCPVADRDGANCLGHLGVQAGCAAGTTSEAIACTQADVKRFQVVEHLTNVYLAALEQGPVLVQKYYHDCPWSFSNAGGTATGLDGTDDGVCGDQGGDLSDVNAQIKANSAALADQLNLAIDQAVSEATKKSDSGNKIAAICPNMATDTEGNCGGDGSFDAHNFDSQGNPAGGKGSYDFSNPDPWITAVDTGIHPNALGHLALANGVMEGACSELGLFCDEAKANAPVYWDDDHECNDVHRCAYIALYNNTDQTLTRTSYTHDGPGGDALGSFDLYNSDAGVWMMVPPEVIPPGQTGRALIKSTDAVTGLDVATGAVGSVTYSIAGGGSVTISADSPDIGAGLIAGTVGSATYEMTARAGAHIPGHSGDTDDVALANYELSPVQ